MLSQINAKFADARFPVIISETSLKQFALFLSNYNSKNVVMVVDEIFKRKKFHPETNFTKILDRYNIFFIKAGVKNKNFNCVIKICDYINSKNITKDGLIVSIGGGVIGDIVGFCASIYKRGIKLVHIPTTMTSFVDSCIGGKTGINHLNQVNLLGSYYQPEAVFIDTRFLKTLNERDFKSGLVESIKKAIISDQDFFNFIYNNSKGILKLNSEKIHELVFKSINSKIYFSASDIKENYLRLFLNYGHTFGQSLESYYKINQNKITHGEAVSLGMICAAKMQSIIYKDKTIIELHKDILGKYNLPKKISDIKNLRKPDYNKLIYNLTNDKKKTFEHIRFILCNKIGHPHIYKTNNKTIIKKSFEEVII